MSFVRLGIAVMLAVSCMSVGIAQTPPAEAPPADPAPAEVWPTIDPPPEAAAPRTPATSARPAPATKANPAAAASASGAPAPAASRAATSAAPAAAATTGEEPAAAGVGSIWESTAAPAAEASRPPLVRANAAGETLPAVIDARGYMVDPRGMTLYVFDGDTRANSSTCFGVCETLWPPYFAGDEEKAVGDFTIVFRRDGTHQWAYRGKPLYRWARDEKPGDVTGDNVNNVWHLIRE